MVSILIPSRNEKFLNKTIENVLQSATGDFELLVGLDGYSEHVLAHPRVRVIKSDNEIGMRPLINLLVSNASGEHIIKHDAHCCFSKGFNEILAKSCPDNTVVVPRQYALHGETWEPNPNKKYVDYWYIEAPIGIDKKSGKVLGFNSKRWFKYNDKKIDDLMTFQGSCWCMRKSHFQNLNLLDVVNYGHFSFEASEISLKTWLSGGRVLVNKNVWFAHLHKGKKYGRGYRLSNSTLIKSGYYSINLWMNNKWERSIYDLKWLIDKFGPVPTWKNFDWEKLWSA